MVRIESGLAASKGPMGFWLGWLMLGAIGLLARGKRYRAVPSHGLGSGGSESWS